MSTLILVHGLLRCALQELNRNDQVAQATKEKVERDVHRAFVTIAQELERETKTA